MPQDLICDPKNQGAKIHPANSVKKKNSVNGFYTTANA